MLVIMEANIVLLRSFNKLPWHWRSVFRTSNLTLVILRVNLDLDVMREVIVVQIIILTVYHRRALEGEVRLLLCRLKSMDWLVVLAIEAKPHIILSGLNSRHLLLQELFAFIYQWLELIILALNHLGHGLVEEVLGLVGPWRLV
jgi:hypothetical protein